MGMQKETMGLNNRFRWNRHQTISAFCLFLVLNLIPAGIPAALQLPESSDIAGCPRPSNGVWHAEPGNPAIQWCIDHASDGDTIFVYPGTYYEHLDFLGKAIVVKGVAGAAETVVDGGGQGSIVTFLSGEDTTSVLDGLTLRNGGGTDYLSCLRGGGIYAREASCKIIGCTISNNIVGSIDKTSIGGGFRIRYCNFLVMKGCLIRQNEGCYGGGGSLSNTTGIVTGCRFEGNVAFGNKNGEYYEGGQGGALDLYECDGLLVRDNMFVENTAPRKDEYMHDAEGGALQIRDGSPEIKNNLFSRNSAFLGGAIKVALNCSSFIHSNLFLNNSAGDEWHAGCGGAVRCVGDNLSAIVCNNTFCGNGAYQGESGGPPTGGSVYHLRDGGVINNIFLNTRSGMALTLGYGTPNHHNCYWNNADGDVWYPGEGAIFEDPLTGPAESFMLPEASPCIDAGTEIAGLDEYFCGESLDMGAREHCGWAPSRPGFIVLDPVVFTSTDSLGGSALQGGESKISRFRLVNKGVHTLEYEVKHGGAAWYSLEGVLEGELGWNEDEYIRCLFDCTGLSTGRYIDTLTVESNDTTNPALPIEVELSIYTHGVIHVPGFFNAIRPAVEAAVDGDTILVAPGTYIGPFNRDIDPLGKRLAILSSAGWDSTVIDLQSKGRAFYYHTGEDLLSTLSGFTITGGSTDGYGKEYGGGLYGDNASPFIEKCRFTCNFSRLDGGGVSILDPAGISITGCIFDYNSAGDEGGGLHINGYYTDLIVRNCLFYFNDASYRGGGAFLCWDMSGVLENCIFWQNNDDQLGTFHADIEVQYNDLTGYWPGPGNIDEDPLFLDPDNDDFRLFEASPCIDAGNPETPNVPWGGSRRDMGVFEFDKGWYLDDSGIIIHKPLGSGITTFLDDPPACIEPGCPVNLGAAVRNNDATERSFDRLLFILESAESDTSTISDSLVTFAPGALVHYPFSYTVPSDFPQGRAAARVEASLAGDLLHETDKHAKISICTHRADSIED